MAADTYTNHREITLEREILENVECAAILKRYSRALARDFLLGECIFLHLHDIYMYEYVQ